MDNPLKLILPLSLKELVLRQVSVLCSNSENLVFFYQSLQSRLSTCKIKQWQETTEEKLKVGLPESLNKQVINRLQAIGFEVRKWKKQNRSFWFGSEAEIELPDLSKPCLTTIGAIDHRKVAEQYLLCDRLKDWRRYEIACSNCMENHIPLLWHGLSEKEKKGYEHHTRMPSLEYCWPHILKGEEFKLNYLWRESGKNLTSFNQWAFEESAESDNHVATEYFFQKMTPAEREVSLMRTAYGIFGGNALFYLLSVMTPEQQMKIIKVRPVHVLLCFLDWSRLHLLSENADLIWTFLPESDYGTLVRRINIILRSGDDCFSTLLGEFFKNAPLDFIKKSLVGQESGSFPPACRLLCELIEYEDSKSIEVLLRHTDVASVVKLLLHEEVYGVFYECILKEKWQGVVACLLKASLSKEDKETLKKCFAQFLNRRVSGTCVERKFRRFFELLDETDASGDEENKIKKLKLENCCACK